MPYSAIKACLLGLTLEAGGFAISKEQLVTLAELVPTVAELQLVTSYVGDVSELGDVRWRGHARRGGGRTLLTTRAPWQAERFFREVADVPKMAARVSSLLYQQQFLARTGDLRADAATLSTAAAEARGSGRLRVVLEAVLQVRACRWCSRVFAHADMRMRTYARATSRFAGREPAERRGRRGRPGPRVHAQLPAEARARV